MAHSAGKGACHNMVERTNFHSLSLTSICVLWCTFLHAHRKRDGQTDRGKHFGTRQSCIGLGTITQLCECDQDKILNISAPQAFLGNEKIVAIREEALTFSEPWASPQYSEGYKLLRMSVNA